MKSARLRRRIVAALLTLVLAATALGDSTPAAGAPVQAGDPIAEACGDNPEPVDKMYPVKEVLCLLTGPQADLSRPGLLEYFVEAGFLTNAGTLTQRWQEVLESDDPSEAFQTLVDWLLGIVPGDLTTFPPNPDYLPDWDHDGLFGQDTGDATLDDDYSNPSAQSARFRYPCINPDGTVFYQTTTGSCVPTETPGATFKLGTVHKLKIVNARGMAMAAKVWLPEGAETSGRKYPVTVMSPGASERQVDVAMYTQTGVREGFIGITYDQAGQPASEGTALDPYTPVGSVPHCISPGSCRDIQDVTRWINQQTITPIVSLTCEACNVLRGFPYRSIRRNPAYAPTGENIRNPWMHLMDLGHVNLWGQSLGSIGTTSYLYWQDQGHGIDGRSLPRVSAAVGLSGFVPASADVPYQMQTADFDIPGITAYGVLPFPNPFVEVTDGVIGTKEYYDQLRSTRRGNGALQLINYEGGSHGDSINWPFVPRGVWSAHLSTTYGVNWFRCYGQAAASSAACAALRQPIRHLSRAVASEYDPDGPAGSSPSLCLTIPDRATLVQLVVQPRTFHRNLNGDPQFDCTPQ